MADELRKLDAELAALGIDPKELVERFIRAGGPGGQCVNKTSTAVQLRYEPASIEVRAESHRSQLKNRVAARQQLIALVTSRQEAKRAREQAERERRRRQQRGRPKGVKKKMVQRKRHRGGLKKLRGKVSDSDS